QPILMGSRQNFTLRQHPVIGSPDRPAAHSTLKESEVLQRTPRSSVSVGPHSLSTSTVTNRTGDQQDANVRLLPNLRKPLHSGRGLLRFLRAATTRSAARRPKSQPDRYEHRRRWERNSRRRQPLGYPPHNYYGSQS